MRNIPENRCEIRKRQCLKEDMFNEARISSILYFDKTNQYVTSSKLRNTRRRLCITLYDLEGFKDVSGEKFIFDRGSYEKHRMISWDESSFLVNHSTSVLRISFIPEENQINERSLNSFKFPYTIAGIYKGRLLKKYENSGVINDNSSLFILDMLKISDELFITLDFYRLSIFSIHQKYLISSTFCSKFMLRVSRIHSSMKKSKIRSNLFFVSGPIDYHSSKIVIIKLIPESHSLEKVDEIVINLFVNRGYYGDTQKIPDFISFVKNRREKLAVITSFETVVFFDVTTKRMTHQISARTITGHYFSCLQVFRDEFLIVGCTSGNVKVFDLFQEENDPYPPSRVAEIKTFKKIASEKIHGDRINQIECIKEGGFGFTFCTCSDDGEARVVNCKLFSKIFELYLRDKSERISFVGNMIIQGDVDDGFEYFKIKCGNYLILKCFFSFL